jgi:hypothetical protein
MQKHREIYRCERTTHLVRCALWLNYPNTGDEDERVRRPNLGGRTRPLGCRPPRTRLLATSIPRNVGDVYPARGCRDAEKEQRHLVETAWLGRACSR